MSSLSTGAGRGGLRSVSVLISLGFAAVTAVALAVGGVGLTGVGRLGEAVRKTSGANAINAVMAEAPSGFERFVVTNAKADSDGVRAKLHDLTARLQMSGMTGDELAG